MILSKKMMQQPNIPAKANKVLNYILLALLLILIRVWYLGLFQHEKYLELSKKPKNKIQLQTPLRGTIHDRFSIPLAINRINYFASLLYDDIREIPKVKWIKKNNKKIKTFPRKDYIQKLCRLLNTELDLDPQDVEDIIYGKAALFPGTPMMLKDNLTEKQYYRLKALQKDFKGLYADKKAKRFYPQNKVASDIIGFVGQINEKDYFAKQEKLKILETYLKNYQENLPVFLPQGYSSAEQVRIDVEKILESPLLLSELTGKSGIEYQFDQDLKGYCGQTHFEVNTNGKYLKILPGSTTPISGKKIILNISSELQAYAEALLAENEQIRDEKFELLGKDNNKVPKPWIKGGSIVAMVPKTGEILCMASYPRINSNDFSLANMESKTHVSRWLENPLHIARLWDGKDELEREFFSLRSQEYYTERKRLTLNIFLDMILSPKSCVKKMVKSLNTLDEGFQIIKTAQCLLDLSEQPHMHSVIDALYPKDIKTVFNTSSAEKTLILESLSQHEDHVKMLKSHLDLYFSKVKLNDDKLLFLDLLRLLTFDDNLQQLPIKGLTLETHRNLTQAISLITDEVQSFSRKIFHSNNFKIWRQDSFQDYLKSRRKEEKEKNTYQRSYVDYLNKVEKTLFQLFWKNYKWDLLSAFIFETPSEIYELKSHIEKIHHFVKAYKDSREYKDFFEALNKVKSALSDISIEHRNNYLQHLRPYKELKGFLYGYYSQIKKSKSKQTMQDLARSFYPSGGFGYGRSFAYRQSTPLGSIYKVVVAYEALKQTSQRNTNAPNKNLNPLTIIDEIQPHIKTPKGIVLGYTEDGKKITRNYKGGVLPRTPSSHGHLDCLKAIECSSNIYFSLLASDIIDDPNHLISTSLDFGFGNKTGLDLPGEIKGSLPKDLSYNRTGLYAFAIGQHSLIATPVQTAIMLSSLCNDGEILKPLIVRKTIGKEKDSLNLLKIEPSYPFQDYLNEIGIFFPFFLEESSHNKNPSIKFYGKQLFRKLYLPQHIKSYLLKSLHGVVSSSKGNARPEIIRYFHSRPVQAKNYKKLRYELAGKTSTAEIMYNPTLDRETPPILTKDIWFGGVSFKPKKIDQFVTTTDEDPELCVVVYLRFGNFGKEAAPLAAEIITKYRELCEKYHQN